MTFIVGFTGTRDGMSKAQSDRLRWRLLMLNPTEFHHGDCIGADDEAACIAQSLGITVIAHPCDIAHMRARHPSNFVFPEAPPLVRNRNIVDCCHLLLVAPRRNQEELRSGTWATWRYARNVGRTTEVIER